MLIAGLGNPGRRYHGTRHNVGFDLIDVLARRWDAGAPEKTPLHEIREAEVRGRSVSLLKPLTYMNRSGRSVREAMDERAYTPQDCLVVVDDMYLDVGRVRFRRKGSPGGHNGLASIEEWLGSQDYPRLRIGIGPAPDTPEWVDFVLTPFGDEERAVLDAGLSRAADGVDHLLEHGIEATMGRFNRAPEAHPDETGSAPASKPE